jgi:hypothetical protein
MSRAKGPPCVVCGKPVPLRAVTRCPWCRRVLCLTCFCPNECSSTASRSAAQGGGDET